MFKAEFCRTARKIVILEGDNGIDDLIMFLTFFDPRLQRDRPELFMAMREHRTNGFLDVSLRAYNTFASVEKNLYTTVFQGSPLIIQYFGEVSYSVLKSRVESWQLIAQKSIGA